MTDDDMLDRKIQAKIESRFFHEIFIFFLVIALVIAYHKGCSNSPNGNDDNKTNTTSAQH